MSKSLYWNVLALCILVLLVIPVIAHDVIVEGDLYVDYDINISDKTILTGVSQSDLADGLSMAMAAGGHQLDWSTTDWQASVVGAWYDNQNAVSFGLGKKWQSIDALIHGGFTQQGSREGLTVGVTFRF